MAKRKAAKKIAGKKEAKAKPVKKATKEQKPLITKDMLIGEIASTYPETVEIMFKHGMHCVGCGMTAYESLEQGCLAHGLGQEEIDKLVEEMNKAAGKKAK
jgi:hybrid cluster-associated redox disulfide protein